MPWKTSAKMVGARLVFQGTVTNDVGDQRVAEACAVADRIRWVPLGFDARALGAERSGTKGIVRLDLQWSCASNARPPSDDRAGLKPGAGDPRARREASPTAASTAGLWYARAAADTAGRA